MSPETPRWTTRAAWVVHGALLALVALRVWHILLFKLHQDRPLVVASYLALALGLILAARALGRRTPPERRGWVSRRWLQIDRVGVAFLGLLVVLILLFHWGFERAASDGREYFVQVRSLVMDGDLDLRNENAYFGVRGTAAIYPVGAAVLWAPFFAAGHGWLTALDLLGADVATDGYTIPYQRAVGLGTLLYGFVGLILIYQILTFYFSRRVAFGATLTLCVGTFVIWYLVVENSMVHGVSLFATTLFLWVWVRTRADRRGWHWAALGAAAGVMSMVRWQNGLFALVPVAHGLVMTWRAHHWRAALTSAAVCVGSAVASFVPQLVFWRVARGAWFSLPAADHAVQLSAIHMGDVLFSSHHGLFSWTPVVYLAMLGLPLFVRRDPVFGVVLVVGFLLQLYINSTVEIWWGGSGFGARRFANCALVFAVGLAALWEWSRRRPVVAPTVILVVLVGVNTLFMLDVRRGRLPSGEAVAFDAVADSVYEYIGNPFSFPLSAVVAWTRGAPMALYDRVGGRRYNTVRIDFGEPGDERFLGQGWSQRERNPRYSFRWATGSASTIIVPLVEPDTYEIRLRCEPFRHPDATVQEIDLIVNGRPVTRFVLQRGTHEYTARIPPQLLRHNLNQIRFVHKYAITPRSAGLSRDERALAAVFDWLQLRRVPSRGE